MGHLYCFMIQKPRYWGKRDTSFRSRFLDDDSPRAEPHFSGHRRGVPKVHLQWLRHLFEGSTRALTPTTAANHLECNTRSFQARTMQELCKNDYNVKLCTSEPVHAAICFLAAKPSRLQHKFIVSSRPKTQKLNVMAASLSFDHRCPKRKNRGAQCYRVRHQ